MAGVMRGGWKNILAAPMGGGSLDAPGGVQAAGGVGLGAAEGRHDDEDEESAMATAIAMAGHEVRCGAIGCLPTAMYC